MCMCLCGTLFSITHNPPNRFHFQRQHFTSVSFFIEENLMVSQNRVCSGLDLDSIKNWKKIHTHIGMLIDILCIWTKTKATRHNHCRCRVKGGNWIHRNSLSSSTSSIDMSLKLPYDVFAVGICPYRAIVLLQNRHRRHHENHQPQLRTATSGNGVQNGFKSKEKRIYGERPKCNEIKRMEIGIHSNGSESRMRYGSHIHSLVCSQSYYTALSV